MTTTASGLERFSTATRQWFTESFEAPTAAQVGAWDAVADDAHALVVAPTGSGKTLAAFLWAVDRLLTSPVPEPEARCRILYVSPLKALAADVERNLRSPLVGIARTTRALGDEPVDVRVGTRTGDTPAAERRRLATRPPDILITTPESLFLVLTSAARAGLAGVTTVILDEVHVLAGSKRGAHLAVSLERLDEMLPAPAQRIGLSATVRPVEGVATFLAGMRTPEDGGRPVRLVQPPATKQLRIDVDVPVPDLTDLEEEVEPGAAPAGPDLSGAAAGPLPQADLPGRGRTASVWPAVTRRVVDIIGEHRTTLVFTNSRRGAERLTARLNEEWQARLAEAEEDGDPGDPELGDEHIGEDAVDDRDDDPRPAVHQVDPGDPGAAWAAQAPGQSGTALPTSTVIARAHHGSMSREARTSIEDDLKSGRLPAVVATSSLELGIDMGSIDVVVQIGSPPSVASALQRIGRAGHQVGALSHGVVVPVHRGDLMPSVAATVQARTGGIEEVRGLANPLDVLAQQVVAMLAVDDWSVADLTRVLRRSAPYATLGDGSLHAVLDMLAGRYPSEDFAQLRPRIVWDRIEDTLTARPGALRLAATSGGTIPDRGLYGVYLAAGADDVAARGGRRVGELDEEMVFESRVGDTFTLGSSTWRIEDITPDRVLVTPAPGVPGRLPFWKGDQPGRPAELGAALGAMVRAVQESGDIAATVATWGVSDWTRDNLVAYLGEQIEAVGHLPTDTAIVVERFRDELGDWRLVIHSPYGSRVHAPWALALVGRLREQLGMDVAAMHSDDGIVLRLPDVDDPLEDWLVPEGGDRAPASGGSSTVGLADLLLEPEEIQRAVIDALAGSAHFAARFREAAARSLLLPRRRPDGRQPLWQQRQRASQLLSVAARYPDFPVVLEAVRESLQDDFDTAALEDLMRRIDRREVRLQEVTTSAPSPFARSLMFAYVGQFLYDGDAPLAERRAAALALDPELLTELLGQGAGDLADLLDPEAVLRVESEVGLRTPQTRARDAEGLLDVVRRLGPLPLADLVDRCDTGAGVAEDRTKQGGEPEGEAQPEREATDEAGGAVDVMREWLADLARQRRVIAVRVAGREQWAVVEDAGRLRDALGTALPVGLPEALLAPVPDPLGDLLRRHARTHGPFTPADVAARFGLAPGTITPTLGLLEAAGTLVAGRLRPPGARPGARLDGAGRTSSTAVADGEADADTSTDTDTGTSPGTGALAVPASGGTGAREYCDAEVLRRMRRRSLAAARADVEAVPAHVLGIYLPRWHQLGQLRGLDGLLAAVDQLAGAELDVADVETSILPARVRSYAPGLLDELTSAGDVVWVGAGTGRVVLVPADAVPLLAPAPQPLASPLAEAVVAALRRGGLFFRDIVQHVVEAAQSSGEGPTPSASQVEDAVWEAVWAGHVTNDTFAPVRARTATTGSGARSPRAGTAGASATRARRMSRQSLMKESMLAVAGTRGGVRAPVRISTPPTMAGRWSLVGERSTDATLRATAFAASLLERHGVVLRGIAQAEGVVGGFGALYPVLSRLEDSGQIRRGYLVEGQGAAQFALPECVDRLRADAGLRPGALVMAAADPANPYGSLVPWPRPGRDARGGTTTGEGDDDSPGDADAGTGPDDDAVRATRPAAGDQTASTGARPRRIAGADVVLVDGRLVLFVERGGGSILALTDDGEDLALAAHALVEQAPDRYSTLTVRRVDGEASLTSQAPAALALREAGFIATPRGLRLRAPAPGRQRGADRTTAAAGRA
ncbi:Lhr family helicase [Litorihabitans aurantiacus]|uniref:ATP-dependent DNA helicase n=1 Tax=Litorihabitans aurantiacus TaxID=1930061 RepID=A0AA37XFK2_9MICO|nr:DEAD/DEAH box helicase [Litorihabitans aurantiacus]GMA31760.1 ATP-dependent DNA helicase [Litorihabitans aurantiacus]